MISSNKKLADEVNLISKEFELKSRLRQTPHELKERSDGPYLIFELLTPSDRLFQIISEINDKLPQDSLLYQRISLRKRKHPPANHLSLPETALFQTVITESLTVSSSTFGSEFLDRYIRSVSGAEEQIIAKSNHIVLGRRGSGKSSLLLYALHTLKKEQIPCAWISMQTYEGRTDFATIIDLFIDVLRKLGGTASNDQISTLVARLEEIEQDPREDRFDQLIPKIRRALSSISALNEFAVIFLDDLHVVGSTLQPVLLSKLYSVTRDNSIFIKISGIEQLTENYDPVARRGLQTPHDAQLVNLDYNLTMPQKSLNHINSILESHAQYCGLPSIRYISGEGVIDRLVWVAAGVPRDALNIFSSAITRASLKDQRRVSITSINEATSITADVKLNDIASDASAKKAQITSAFELVRKFCINEIKKNAFLVEIGVDAPALNLLRELIALRLLHVVHEGVTPNEAGRRYMALMLDYGFYVGIRTARSVDVFQKDAQQASAKDLRNLPIFSLDKLKALLDD